MSFNWAFIGCGGIAVSVAKQLKDTDNKIVAAFNRSFEKAEKFTSEFGGTAYRTADEAIADERVQAVYIATPNDTHAKYSRMAMLAGKPVLCEKPFAMNSEETKEILTLAEERGVYAAEAMWTWHNPVSLRVREWIESGRIGEVRAVEASYAFPMLRRGDTTSRLVNRALGGGALVDIGIYPIRYVYELFGLPEKTEASGTIYNGVDVDEHITMKYPAFEAKLYVSFKGFKGESMTITGTKGKITVPFFHMAEKAQLKTDKTERFSVQGGLTAAYRNEFDDTAADILAGKTESDLVPHRATRDIMAIMDDCRRQMGVVYPGEEKPDLNTRIKAISHVGFNCRDMKKVRDFYTKIMGCAVQFELTYRDMAADIRRKAEANGEPVPGYADFLEKQGERVWNVYLKWADVCFIELFDQIGAIIPSVPGNHSLNYTHFSLEVENIRDFRQAIIDRGGAEYIEGEIAEGIDGTLQLWIHDPEGNRFELMEYTDRSCELYGRG